ncbi:early lactation protein-like [Panthera tigris]|uniref:early lactation protein-like n=1 Tax=Panthera tigris TaxID=9694 RepID=UPI001C6FA1E2|nr:early lactation protein-like [Panthera tigris]
MKVSLFLALCFPFCLVGIASSEKTSAHLEREAPQELLQTLPALCRLPPVEGPCRGRFYRYFYNSTAHECEHFTYGGCRGNANNFETTEMCRRVCKPPGDDVRNDQPHEEVLVAVEGGQWGRDSKAAVGGGMGGEDEGGIGERSKALSC